MADKIAKEGIVHIRYDLVDNLFETWEQKQSYERGWMISDKRPHTDYQLAKYDAEVRMSRLRLAGYSVWLDDQAKYFWEDLINVRK